MRKPTAVALAAFLAAGSASGQERPQVGRYQLVAVPASQAQTFPETLLLDTATGQTWMLYHETGQAIEWLPLRFSAGKVGQRLLCRPRPTPLASRAKGQPPESGASWRAVGV